MRTFTSLLPVSMKDSKILLVLRVSLHCLIYKVQTARVQRELYFTTAPPACQALFSDPSDQRSHPRPSRELF